jgi:hypothetical protein
MVTLFHSVHWIWTQDMPTFFFELVTCCGACISAKFSYAFFDSAVSFWPTIYCVNSTITGWSFLYRYQKSFLRDKNAVRQDRQLDPWRTRVLSFLKRWTGKKFVKIRSFLSWVTIWAERANSLHIDQAVFWRGPMLFIRCDTRFDQIRTPIPT